MVKFVVGVAVGAAAAVVAGVVWFIRAALDEC